MCSLIATANINARPITNYLVCQSCCCVLAASVSCPFCLYLISVSSLTAPLCALIHRHNVCIQGVVAEGKPAWATEVMQQSHLPVELSQPRRLSRNRRAPDLVGKRLRVRLDDKEWYTGSVVRYNSVRKRYLLLWDEQSMQAGDTVREVWYRIDSERNLVEGKWKFVQARDSETSRRERRPPAVIVKQVSAAQKKKRQRQPGSGSGSGSGSGKKCEVGLMRERRGQKRRGADAKRGGGNQIVQACCM